ncbi:hypothetical protein BUALT_Bualt19G0073300 [Buddleja alternifolia]|uniref:NADH dehydrogenase subunit 6 n=1 Tax=Buddleja alternifolia TaxID=168488 RepID=A0AAV6W5Y6_9LAMI|nr:hypothetical protein BUALT_Bualt19G0073300 [Buddleja alternifolia]
MLRIKSYQEGFRWLDVSFSLPTSIFRWPRLFASYLTPPSLSSGLSLALSSLEPGRWTSRFSLPDIDDVVWSVVSAVESVALVSFLFLLRLESGGEMAVVVLSMRGA